MEGRTTWLGVAVGLIVFAVYLPGLDAPFSYDAADSVAFFIAVDDWTTSITQQRYFNNHPMYSFIAHGVYAITGSRSELALRLPAVAFAATAIGVLVATTARRFGLAAAVLAGVVVAGNDEFSMLGREARGYSLLVLCTVVSSVELSRRWHGEVDRRWLYVASVAVGVATHFGMLLVVLAHLTAGVASRRLHRDDCYEVAGALLLGVVPYALMSQDLADSIGAEPRHFMSGFPADLVGMLLNPWVLGAVAVGLGAVAAPSLWRSTGPRAAAAALAGSIAFIWLVMQPGNLAPRMFLPLLPALAWVAAAGAARVDQRAVVAAAGLGVFAAAISFPHPGGGGVDYRAAAALIDRVPPSVTACVPNRSIPPTLAYTDGFEFLLQEADMARCDVVVAVAPTLDPQLLDLVGERFAAMTVASDGTVVAARSPAMLPAVDW